MTADKVRAMIRTYWGLIALCVLIGGLGGFAASRSLAPARPSFVSSALIRVDLGAAATYAQIATTPDLLSEVASRYPGLSATRLKAEITAAPVAATALLQITATDTDAKRAAALANDVAHTLITRTEQAAQQRAQEAQQQIEPQIAALQQEINTTTTALNALQGQQANSSQASALSAHLSSLQLHLVLLQWSLEQNQLDAVVLTPLVFIQEAQPDTSPAHSRLTQDVL